MIDGLRADRLGKRYRRRVWGLREVTMAVPEGSIAALVGPNGAGKTTLLRMLAGLVLPTEGTIEVLGQPLRAGSAEAVRRVGYVAQHHPLYRGFRVADLLTMGRRLNPDWDQRLAEDRLADLGIPSERRIRQLSVGQQAQVALTMALAKRSRLLLLDEPLADLDPIARRDFVTSMTVAVVEHGLTILLSSHIVVDLERVCDHLVVLHEGRVRLSGPVEEIVAAHRILTGPLLTSTAGIEGLVTATHSERHSSLLVRQNGTAITHPAWQSAPVGLEEVILGYLEPQRAEGQR